LSKDKCVLRYQMGDSMQAAENSTFFPFKEKKKKIPLGAKGEKGKKRAGYHQARFGKNLLQRIEKSEQSSRKEEGFAVLITKQPKGALPHHLR